MEGAIPDVRASGGTVAYVRVGFTKADCDAIPATNKSFARWPNTASGNACPVTPNLDVVFLAVSASVGRVALKAIRGEFADDAEYRARFR